MYVYVHIPFVYIFTYICIYIRIYIKCTYIKRFAENQKETDRQKTHKNALICVRVKIERKREREGEKESESE